LLYKLILEIFMTGSIRVFGGLLLCLGAVGGLDSGSDVVSCVVVATIGLVAMYSGVVAMKRVS
jgi:hypothetical protein